MAVFLSDSFTDTDGTLLQNHSPETGGTWGKLVANYFGDIRGNATIRSNGVEDRSDFYRNAADPGSAEYTITGDIFVDPSGNNASSNAYNYFTARMTPTGTAYADVDMYIAGRDGGVIGGTRGWRIAKIVSGTLTLLDSPDTNPTGGTYSLEFVVTDASKTFDVDAGAEISLSTVDNDITQNGRVGLNVGREGARMEDIAAETAGAAFDSASLFATGDGTIVDVVNESDAASPLSPSVDDDPASPDDNDWVNNAVDVVP